jgi:DNA-binding LytR/AlgR family response regulator
MPKCVIAEDEVLFRKALAELLRETWPELEIVAECEDGGSALDAIGEHQPDVAFLDIRMPGLTGIEVAGALAEASPKTQIVFVTAYDQYAIDAFNKGAIDYLLKPIVPERLAQTVTRLKERLADKAPAAPDSSTQDILEALAKQLGVASPKTAALPLAWITATVGKETRLILIEDVIYFQSDNKYTVVMTPEGEALVRKPLRELLDVLDPANFKQIHRATIVNMKAVQSITRDEFGKGVVKLRNRPETLTVSQTFMALFRSM